MENPKNYTELRRKFEKLTKRLCHDNPPQFQTSHQKDTFFWNLTKYLTEISKFVLISAESSDNEQIVGGSQGTQGFFGRPAGSQVKTANSQIANSQVANSQIANSQVTKSHIKATWSQKSSLKSSRKSSQKSSRKSAQVPSMTSVIKSSGSEIRTIGGEIHIIPAGSRNSFRKVEVDKELDKRFNKTSSVESSEVSSEIGASDTTQTSSPGVGLNSSFDDESGESLNGGPLFDENEEYQEKVTQKEVLNKRRNALVENDINKGDKIRIDELKKVTHTQILTVKCVSNDSEGEGFATPASTSDEDSSVRMPRVHQIDKNNNEINAAKPPPGFENIKPNLQVGSKLDLNAGSEQNHVIDTFTNFEARERKIPDNFYKYPIPGQVQTLSQLSKTSVKSSTKLVSPKKIPKINDDEKSLSSQFSDDSELCFKKTAVIEDSRSKLNHANRYSQVLMFDNKDMHKNERAIYHLKIAPIEKKDGQIWCSIAHGHAPEMCFMHIDGTQYSKQSLTDLQTRMQQRYKTRATESIPPKKFYDEIKIGGIVVTKYQIDGRFYRAMVIDIYDKPARQREMRGDSGSCEKTNSLEFCGKSFLVFYIDYGNIEMIHPGEKERTKHLMFPLEVEFITDEPARAIPFSFCELRSVVIEFGTNNKPSRKYVNIPTDHSNFKSKNNPELCRNNMFVSAYKYEDISLSHAWVSFKPVSIRKDDHFDSKNKNGHFAFRHMVLDDVDSILSSFERIRLQKEREEEISKKGFGKVCISYEINKEVWQYSNTEFGMDLEDYFNDIRVKSRGREQHFYQKILTSSALALNGRLNHEEEVMENNRNQQTDGAPIDQMSHQSDNLTKFHNHQQFHETPQNEQYRQLNSHMSKSFQTPTFTDNRTMLNALTKSAQSIFSEYKPEAAKLYEKGGKANKGFNEFKVSEWLKETAKTSSDEDDVRLGVSPENKPEFFNPTEFFKVGSTIGGLHNGLSHGLSREFKNPERFGNLNGFDHGVNHGLNNGMHNGMTHGQINTTTFRENKFTDKNEMNQSSMNDGKLSMQKLIIDGDSSDSDTNSTEDSNGVLKRGFGRK